MMLWSPEAQIRMMCEEAAELIQVLLKRGRNRNGSTIEEVVSELVDVEIMLGQMKNIYGLNQDMWATEKKRKLARLVKRLAESRGQNR
jgi:hypothetical protein